MRRAFPLARVAVLAGPFVLAFFAGGFYDTPRLIAALVFWALVAVVAIAGAPVLPAGRGARAALAGLTLLAVWTALSRDWSPLPGQAYHDTQRLILYVGFLMLAGAVLRPEAWRRAVEPALAAGTVAVVGYGLLDRLLPGVFTHAFSFAAAGRLHQPLTYWNAMGAVAALGLVLCARLAGDASRSAAARALAAAAAAPLGAGLYLTFSRGALAGFAAALAVLIAVAPTWSQLRAIGLTALLALAAALAASALPALATYNEKLGTREAQGATMAVILLALALAGATVALWSRRAELAGRIRGGRLPLPPRAGLIATAAVALAAIGFVAVAAKERRRVEAYQRATPTRLTSVQSNRYEYWRVARSTFADHPLRGVGSGGFAAEWLRERPIPESTRNAHSLYLETAAELGLVGLIALALFVGGIAAAAREALRRSRPAAAGPVAAVTLLAFHAGIDWDWQMPAVTLLALTLAAALFALAEPG